MSALSPLSALAFAAALWIALHRVNRRRGWFRTGELLFWDAIILIVVGLASLRWW
jgi:hypothetical protein